MLYQLGSLRRHIAKLLSLQFGRSFVSSSGWMHLPCISRFRTSLSDELCLATHSLRLSISRVPFGWLQLGSWSSFCLEPVLSCFSTLVKFSLASGK